MPSSKKYRNMSYIFKKVCHMCDNDKLDYIQTKGYYIIVVWALGCLENVLMLAYFEYDRVYKIIMISLTGRSKKAI